MTEEKHETPRQEAPRPQEAAPQAAAAAAPGEHRPGRRRPESRRKVCRLCADQVEHVDYKQFQLLRAYTMESGKMLPGRVTGACARHQRQIARAIKRNRNLSILPYIQK